jgi:hypothetical protein
MGHGWLVTLGFRSGGVRQENPMRQRRKGEVVGVGSHESAENGAVGGVCRVEGGGSEQLDLVGITDHIAAFGKPPGSVIV